MEKDAVKSSEVGVDSPDVDYRQRFSRRALESILRATDFILPFGHRRLSRSLSSSAVHLYSEDELTSMGEVSIDTPQLAAALEMQTGRRYLFTVLD